MPIEISEKEIYEEAKRRVKKKREFYGHLGAYVLVNVVLVVVWALSYRGYLWFLWPLGIWGVFVLWNFIDVFVLSGRAQSEKAAIEKEAERIKKER
jgi:cobalamin biosynthesis protein CobD/CbiB